MDVVPDNKVHGANTGPIWGKQDQFEIDQSICEILWNTIWIWYFILHEINNMMKPGVDVTSRNVTANDNNKKLMGDLANC